MVTAGLTAFYTFRIYFRPFGANWSCRRKRDHTATALPTTHMATSRRPQPIMRVMAAWLTSRRR